MILKIRKLDLPVVVSFGKPPSLDHHYMAVGPEANAYLITPGRLFVDSTHKYVDHFAVANHRIESSKSHNVTDAHGSYHRQIYSKA